MISRMLDKGVGSIAFVCVSTESYRLCIWAYWSVQSLQGHKPNCGIAGDLQPNVASLAKWWTICCEVTDAISTSQSYQVDVLRWFPRFHALLCLGCSAKLAVNWSVVNVEMKWWSVCSRSAKKDPGRFPADEVIFHRSLRKIQVMSCTELSKPWQQRS